MAKDLQQKASLAQWFTSQNKYSSMREMARALEMPFNTLRGYFSGKKPSSRNLARLIATTGLDLGLPARPRVNEPSPTTVPSSVNKRARVYTVRLLENLHFDLIRCLSSIPPVQKVLGEGTRPNRSSLRKRAQLVKDLMDALERNVSQVLDDPEALQIMRETLSGSDAGYLSGLLGSLFDDRRLRTWQQMTTYKYGSK